MNVAKGFEKGSEAEKAFNTYLRNDQPVYVAYRQKDGTFVRTTNGRATSVAKKESELSKAYQIK